MFSGRSAEIELLKKALIQTRHGNPYHLLICGERGIGKSSLLMLLDYIASDKAFDGFSFLTLRVELDSSTTYVEMIKKIGHALKESISKKDKVKALAVKAWTFLSGWEILGVSYNKRENSPDEYQLLNELVELFVNVIKQAESEIDGVVLLIDEADIPDESAHLGRFIKLFTEKLTFAQAEKTLIVLAGQPTVMERLKASHESSLRILQAVSLGTLKPEDSAWVIERGLEQAKESGGIKVEIASSAKNLIVELSEGYPHFLQQFSFSAFDADTNNLIDDEDVRRGAFGEYGALNQLGSKFFAGLYYNQISSDDYRRVLNTMAEFSDQWVSRAQIIDLAKIKNGHTVDNALRALKDRRIIQAQEGVKGHYRLPTKSFAAWIKALQSLDTANRSL
jgi:hypothetical protein